MVRDLNAQDDKVPIIEVKNLSIRRAEKTVLNALNFDIYKQDFIAIMGANGIGKSSLIAALLGLIAAHTKECKLYGQAFSKYTHKARAQLIGFVPQLHNTSLDMSVKTWCEMARFPYQSWGFHLSEQDKARIENAIALTKMQKYIDTPLDNLSGGERQKALIAGVLAQDTPIIFLDEPLNHLDLKHQAEILQLLKILNDEHDKTIICVMHEMNQVARYCKQVLGLNKDGILFQGACETVMTAENLSALYHYPIHCVQDFVLPNNSEVYPMFVAG